MVTEKINFKKRNKEKVFIDHQTFLKDIEVGSDK